MLQVEYDFYGEGEDYTNPSITITIKHNNCNIVFCPEVINYDDVLRFTNDVDNGRSSYITSHEMNREYNIYYSPIGTVEFEVSAYGTGVVGSLSVEIPYDNEIAVLFGQLLKLAQCIRDNIEYDCTATKSATKV